jgi:allantoinase
MSGLSLFWSKAEEHNMTISDVVRLLSSNPAKLANLGHRKGAIRVGYDADFVVWDPEATIQVHFVKVMIQCWPLSP